MSETRTYQDYRIYPSSSQEPAPEGRSDQTQDGLTVIAIYLSPVALVLHVQAKDPSPTDNQKSERQEDLLQLARDVHLRIREHGYHQPCVVMLEASEQACGYYRPWSANQEWHRGEFLLFVEVESRAEDRLRDLLFPTPPGFQDLPGTDRSEQALFDSLRAEVSSAGTLLDGFERQWEQNEKDLRSSLQAASLRRDPPAGPALDSGNRLERVTSITLQNFRGFAEDPVTLDTDADLVLVVGPNGYGKSSILEAVSLAVNGTLLGRTPNSLSHRTKEGDSVEKVSPFVVKVTGKPTPVESVGAEAGSEAVTITRTVKPSDAENGYAYVLQENNQLVEAPSFFSTQSGEQHSDPDRFFLNARLSGWFAEDVELLFDDASRGKTLKSVFAPTPIKLRALDEFLKKQLEELSQSLAKPLDPLWEYRTKRQDEFFEWLLDVCQFLAQFPTLFPMPPLPFDQPEQLASEALNDWFIQVNEALLERISRSEFSPWNFQQVLFDRIKKERTRLLQTLDPEAQEELGRLDEKLKREQEAYHQVVSTLAALEGSDTLPGLTLLVRSLRHHRLRWQSAAARLTHEAHGGPPLPVRVLKELNALSGEALEGLHADLMAFEQGRRAFLQDYEAAQRRHETLQKRQHELIERAYLREEFHILENLGRDLRALFEHGDPTPYQLWNRLRDVWDSDAELPQRLAAREAWSQEQAIVQKLQSARQVQEKDEAALKLRNNLHKAARQIFSRFAFADAEDIELQDPTSQRNPNALQELGEVRDEFHLVTPDGRALEHWSAGQKAQLAVVMMVAQSLVAQRLAALPHRLLILDDVSTAYDLSNITREALLWRQLAFTQDRNFKRQLFLSSHHEELTQHLFDLLVPPASPEDCLQENSVRVIKCVGWDSKNGPVLETYQLQPDRRLTPSDGGPVQGLTSSLKELFQP